jgi:hypothetical protein
MRRAVTITAVATLIMAGIIIKLIVGSGETVASTEATNTSIETAMPIYDLHVRHPHIGTLPVEVAPQP